MCVEVGFARELPLFSSRRSRNDKLSFSFNGGGKRGKKGNVGRILGNIRSLLKGKYEKRAEKGMVRN